MNKRQSAADNAYYLGARAWREHRYDAKNPYEYLRRDSLNAYLWHAWELGYSDQQLDSTPLKPK